MKKTEPEIRMEIEHDLLNLINHLLRANTDKKVKAHDTFHAAAIDSLDRVVIEVKIEAQYQIKDFIIRDHETVMDIADRIAHHVHKVLSEQPAK